MKGIYLAREDGHYDIIAAFDLEKIDTLPNSDANGFFETIIQEMTQENADFKVHEAESISDFPDVLTV